MLGQQIKDTIEKQKGILFAKPAIVHRIQYSGRDIIAKNKKFEEGYMDERGYVPVEWWIMSLTQAENAIMKEGEGLSFVYVHEEGKEKLISLKNAVQEEEELLLGTFKSQWPLTKILDIGGDPIETSFHTKEVPPIPCHVHAGEIVNGEAKGPGKLEAYFFPPVNVPPYNTEFETVITRIGLLAATTQEDVIACLKQFGKDDSIYTMCNVFEVQPYDGWTVPPGTLHAPGPWTTFEIQRPQDDYNLASWQLGKRLEGEEQGKMKQEHQLRGLENEERFMKEVVDWDLNIDQDFETSWRRNSTVIKEGEWGRQLRIFFDAFYGEGFEVRPGHTFRREADAKPFAGIVWSGKGLLNENTIDVDVESQKEFLVTPHTSVEIKNTGETPLLIYTVFPLEEVTQ